MQMGVAAVRVDEKFAADLVPANEFPPEGSLRGAGDVLTLDHRENATFLATAFLLDRNEGVRWTSDGTIIIHSDYAQGPARFENFAQQFGVTATLRAAEPDKPAFELKRPRVAIYQPWTANADEGWTEWVLDRYKIPYTVLHNADILKPGLRDALRYVDFCGSAGGFHSARHPAWRNRRFTRRQTRDDAVTVQRPEYAGGIGIDGLQARPGIRVQRWHVDHLRHRHRIADSIFSAAAAQRRAAGRRVSMSGLADSRDRGHKQSAGVRHAQGCHRIFDGRRSVRKHAGAGLRSCRPRSSFRDAIRQRPICWPAAGSRARAWYKAKPRWPKPATAAAAWCFLDFVRSFAGNPGARSSCYSTPCIWGLHKNYEKSISDWIDAGFLHRRQRHV